ncbi:Signal recognition particle 14 kDa protein [Capsicum annuum]|uniref:Signal recognition particle 14 kDa protein n=1 Tax=Capsicum annuum TaxID=4072 RepID=A0A2G2Z9I2_CAPAN|nr:Signal recognition particle 14 kDa protein [Capsicum annuum]
MKRTTGHGSVWVTLKHSSDKSKAQRNKMKTAGKNIEFKCLIRATGGKKNISIMVITVASSFLILFHCSVLLVGLWLCLLCKSCHFPLSFCFVGFYVLW